MLTEFATVWHELFPVEQARITQLLVARVDVQENALGLASTTDRSTSSATRRSR
jgi:hypothetical protein